MSIAIVHSLAQEQLRATKKFLETELQSKTKLYHFHELSKIKQNQRIFFLHFDLANEIDLHQKLYLEALEQGYQNFLNPYDAVAEMADDKFAFSQFLLANEFLCPTTKKYLQGSKVEQFALDDFVLKPNSGTERLDVYFSSAYSEAELQEFAQKILSYDDLLVQNRVYASEEFRIVSLCGKLYANKENCPQVVFNKVTELIQCLSLNHTYDLKSSVIAFDVLQEQANLYILEMNIRPAALYSFAFSQEQMK